METSAAEQKLGCVESMELGDDWVAIQFPAQDQMLGVRLGVGEVAFLL
jgi:hypothetical protein